MNERLPTLTPLQAREVMKQGSDRYVSLRPRHNDVSDVILSVVGQEIGMRTDITDRGRFEELRLAREWDFVLSSRWQKKPVAVVLSLVEEIRAENKLLGEYLMESQDWIEELRERTNRLLDILCLDTPEHPVSECDRHIAGKRHSMLTVLAYHENGFAETLKANTSATLNDFIHSQGYFAPPGKKTPDESGQTHAAVGAVVVQEKPDTQAKAPRVWISEFDPRIACSDVMGEILALRQQIQMAKMDLEWMEQDQGIGKPGTIPEETESTQS